MDFFDRGNGIEVDPFLRIWKRRGLVEPSASRGRAVQRTLGRLLRRPKRAER